MKKMVKETVIVVAPHPDDEVLGCGGTLLRHKEQGDEVHWMIVADSGLAIESSGQAAKLLSLSGVAKLHQGRIPVTKLDAAPVSDLIAVIGAVFKEVKPHTVYLPHPGDIHTDHRAVFDAAASCTKWFRYESIKRVLAYETLSETDFAIDPRFGAFSPNVFVDVSAFLEKKIEWMRVYQSEMKPFPFPRSEEAIRAQAVLRGAAAGVKAAEAFMLLKEIR